MIKRIRVCGGHWRQAPWACLAISVGKKAHEGENLEAALRWLADSGKPYVFRVSDSLQRHNLMMHGVLATSAHAKANQLGNEWLERNSPMFSILPQPPVIVRWDELLFDPSFEEAHTAFMSLSKSDSVLRHALQEDISQFLGRKNFSSAEQKALFAAHSRAFLIEELAGHTLLARKYPYANLYPSKDLNALGLLRAGAIQNAPNGLDQTFHARFTIRSINPAPTEDMRRSTRQNGNAMSSMAIIAVA
jgi:tRNA-dependent cyclodipeptide synthase